MHVLKNYLNSVHPLEEKEWNALSSLFSMETINKGDPFAVEGRKETKIGFLLNGVLRAFYRNNNGTEYNKTFFTDAEFFGAYASLVTGKENYINIEALTDCKAMTTDYSRITDLFADYRNIETLCRKLAESFYIHKEKREIQMVMMNAEERYKLFKDEYPGLENLIPQYHIASYLGVTPTQLSRIRAKK